MLKFKYWKIEKGLKEIIEKYVADWHWNEDSKKYAYEMGKFLFSFINYLEDQILSEKSKRKHINQLPLIGMFESNFGYNDEFKIKNLENGPHYAYEFERKVSDLKYAKQSYQSTWKKLDKYIKSGDYKEYLDKVQEKLTAENQISRKF